MKYLCICQYGHSRSVAMVRILHQMRLPAVAIGWATSGDAIAVLAEWADKILAVDGNVKSVLGHEYKMIPFDVGPDQWSNPYHPELRAKLIGMTRLKRELLGLSDENLNRLEC